MIPRTEVRKVTAMAGHSQFKNIMHRKGKQDAVRAKLFSKLAREITVAARQGLPDPAMNARLRLAIQNARAQSMPKDNIQRSIDKASGGDAETMHLERLPQVATYMPKPWRALDVLMAAESVARRPAA